MSLHQDEAGQRAYHHHSESNGQTYAITDGQGHLAWEGWYSTRGSLIQSHAHHEDLRDQPLRYQGQYHDEESGLCYNRFRYYDAEIGRFTTPDPLGVMGGFHSYDYPRDPIQWVDPLGLVRNYHNMKPIPGFQKHHIIPQSLGQHTVLQKAQFSMHSPKNVIYLPTCRNYHSTRSVHRGPHKEYTLRVRAELEKLNDKGKQQAWSQQQYATAVNNVMFRYRQALRKGRPLAKNPECGKCAACKEVNQ